MMGHQVAVFEAAPGLGGQVATCLVGGVAVERFYHHIFTSDEEIIGLIQELGLGPRLRWLPSSVGLYYGGRVYDFTTPGHLLRFRPLSLVDRLRLGLVSLYLRHLGDWAPLEKITAQEWITRFAGERNYQVVWGPLLRGKFGDKAALVGMVWFWGKMRTRFASRGRSMQRERLGYLEGSFGLLIDAMAERIRNQGGQIHLSAPVTGIRVEGQKVAGLEAGGGVHPCQAVVATVASPIFLRLVPGLGGDYAQKLESARYQATLCLLLVLRHSLSHIYWLNIGDPEFPFVGAIEHTNLVDPSFYDGRRILYLSNYLDPGDPLYPATALQILEKYIPYLQRVNPRFQKDWIEKYFLFRDEAAQPIITTHYSVPSHVTPIQGLYLANSTQIYPQDRGMNYSIHLGNEVARIASMLSLKEGD